MRAEFSKLMDLHLYAFTARFCILFFLPGYWVLGLPHPKTLLVLGLTICLSKLYHRKIRR